MCHSLLSFHVRITSFETIEDIVTRVEKSLRCTFIKSLADELSDTEAFETKILGLWITLNCHTDLNLEHNKKTYQLIGDVPENFDMPWDDSPVIDISSYILGLLVRNDSSDWYKPSQSDLLHEAGLK